MNKKKKIAWEKFTYSGKIEDYLYFKELGKRK